MQISDPARLFSAPCFSGPARPRHLIGVFLAAAVLGACDRKKDEPMPEASASAPSKEAPPRCIARPSTKSFSIRGGDQAAGEVVAGIDQPFAVEIGSGVALAEGFAVAALGERDKSSHALVAITNPEATRGRLVDLGPLHGQIEPPHLAVSPAGLLAAVVDNDASSSTLRLARLDEVGDRIDVVWGPEVQQGRDDSNAASLAASGKGAVLVWDDRDSSRGHSVLRGIHFDPSDFERATKPRDLSPPDDDAEAPAVVARPGGYWLAWVSYGKLPKSPAKTPATGQVESDADEGDLSEPGIVDIVPRRLRLAPMGADGLLAGEPRFLSPEGSHVLVFDLVPAEDGGVFVAWRDDPTAFGSEGGTISLARVGPDGSVKNHEAADERVGAGLPFLLRDESTGSAYVSVGGAEGATLLGLLEPDGSVRDFEPERALRSRQTLAVRAGKVLVGMPRGRDVELGIVTCSSRP